MAGNVPPRGQAPRAAGGGPAVEPSPNDHYINAGYSVDLYVGVRRVRGGSMMAAKDVSREGVIDALKVIMKVCENQRCAECPLHDNARNGCYMTGYVEPENWNLNDDEGI